MRKNIKKRKILGIIKKKIFYYFLLFLFFFILFIFLFNSDFFRIKNIKVEGENWGRNESSMIAVETLKVMDEKYFNFFDKRNILFYPRDEIEKKIINNFPFIKKIKFSRDFDKKELILSIEKEKEKYIFCQKDNNFYILLDGGKRKKIDKPCYSVSEKGKIFAFIFKKKDDNKLIIESNDKIYKEGKYIFSSIRERENIEDFISKLKKEFNIKIQKLEIINKLFYKFYTDEGVAVVLATNFDSKKEISKLKKVLNKVKDLKLEKGHFTNKVAYINLFLDKRINYCMRGDICEKK